GLIHVAIGKESFDAASIAGNLFALIDAIVRVKPNAAKGVYCRSITLTGTMTPGVPLDVAKTLEQATTATA
ncbi:MAG: hypothetical protein ACREFP_02070, partial [Acetobacteraceae bacterium]